MRSLGNAVRSRTRARGRAAAVIAALPFVLGCGQRTSTPAKAPPAESPPSAENGAAEVGGPAHAFSAPGPPVRLEGASRLARFFAALAGLEDGSRSGDVRVLQYGDSHTAADMNTDTLRRLLQARFGDGGRGFVSLGIPWRAYTQTGILGGMTPGFAPCRARGSAARAGEYDNAFGLLGVALTSETRGARAWTEVAAPTSEVEVDYLEQPQGGSFDVLLDGVRQKRVATRAPSGAGYATFRAPEGPHRIEVRAGGDGPVRIFGLALDRASAGLTVDSLGLNGAQVFWPLRWGEAAFGEQLRHRRPDLVVLAYGTNEALDPKLDLHAVERAIAELLGRIARAAPEASCLLLGPPDLARKAGTDTWATWPPVVDVIATERRVASAGGCAFFDQMQAMGGAGSMAAWAVEPVPRALPDRVHLRRRGYAELATALASDLMLSYDAFRAPGAQQTERPGGGASADR